MKFRKKPVVVEAVQLNWGTWSEMCDFLAIGKGGQAYGVAVHDTDNDRSTDNPGGEFNRIGLVIPTLEGDMLGVENDWIIKGVQGEFYPCKPDIFEQTYEPVVD
jgi:hypothetical protein